MKKTLSKTTLNTMIAGAFATTMALSAMPANADHHEGAAEADKEKCYGVVKAGKNDCGNAAGTHTCAGHAATDAEGGEWLFLPKGVCERLAGGSLEPVEAEMEEGEEQHDHEDHDHDDHHMEEEG